MPFKDPEEKKRRAKVYSRRHYEKNRDAYKQRSKEAKQKVREDWWEFKKTLKCINCGFAHPAALDFHHVIRGPDNRKVHRLVANHAFISAKKEIEKCVVLCANCHRIHHYEEAIFKKTVKRKKKSSSTD